MEFRPDEQEPVDETPITSALSVIPTNFTSKDDVRAFLKNPEFRAPPEGIQTRPEDARLLLGDIKSIRPGVFGNIDFFHFKLTQWSVIAYGEIVDKPGKFCVAKFVNPDCLGDAAYAEKSIKRFRREIDFLSRHQKNPLWIRVQKIENGRHPFIQNLTCACPYLVLDFCHGINGYDFCKAPAFRGASANSAFLSAFALASLRVLADVSSEERVHRDFKPDNVMVTPHKFVFLDPGAITEQESDLTPAGGVIGTPEFMSPEQAMGRPLDFRSDLYSLGACLFFFATKRFPFEGANSMEIMVKHIQEPLCGSLLDNLPPILKAAILTLLEKRPANRFQNLDEAAEVFRPLVQGTEMENFLQPTLVRPSSFMPVALDET